jgi:hypothetical protein
MTFEELFRRRTGRVPTPEEIREGLWFEDAVKSGINPMTLLYVADVAHADERKRFVSELRSIADETVSTIRAGLPTNPEWAKATAWATTLVYATKAQAAIIGLAVAIVAAVFGIGGFRIGTAVAGWGNHRTVCADLQNDMTATAEYYERTLHLPSAAAKIRAVYFKSCR